MKGIEEPASDPRGKVSRLDPKGALLILRRYKLFRKLGLR